ncbi:hypothetical protein D3C87_1216930 [compost metagenome]
MHADRMDLGVPRHVQHAMQQPAALGAGDGNIEVAVFANRVFRQQRIAVVAVGIDRIAAIGEITPHAVGQKLVLRGLWPVVVARGVPIVFADDFLQKHQVRRGAAYRFAQLRQDESAVERGESLVSIDGQHTQSMDGRWFVQRY